MRLSGLVPGRRSQVALDRCRGERGLERLVSGGGLRRCPHPLAVRPEAEDRAEHDADIVGREVGELAGLAKAVCRDADRSPLDQQPDSVEREEHDGLARDRGALPVPEAPVPVGDVTGDRRDDDRDGGAGQRYQMQAQMQPAVDEVVDHDAQCADDAELGALVDEQPETLIEPSHTAHRCGPPFDCVTSRCYPRRATSKRCRQDYRAGRHRVAGARIPRSPAWHRSRRPVIHSVLSAPAGRVAYVADPDILIRARGLTKLFGEFLAVDGIDFELSRGEVFGFLGPNGAGKSSTMRMIGCVSPRSGGELTILGLDPDRHGPAIRARLGVVPQEDTLDVELTVRENLLIYGGYFGLRRDVIRERTAKLLDFVQLTERADDEVEPLSGGMKRRLTIARSLISEPDILLLDEPTTGLDPQARHVVWDRLYRLKQQGVTLVLTTHYMDEAEQLCDRLVVMDRGKIAAEGSPRQLIETYSTPEVLELRFALEEQEQAADKLADVAAERIEVLADRILLYTADGDTALDAVRARGLHPVTSLVRRSTLEDVFLRLTGRRLED